MWPTRKCQQQHLIALGRNNKRNLGRRGTSSGWIPLQVTATCHYAEKEKKEEKITRLQGIQIEEMTIWWACTQSGKWTENKSEEEKKMATFPQSNGSHGSEDCWADTSHSVYYWSQAGSGKAYLMPRICLLPSIGWRKTGDVNSTARMTTWEWCLFWTFSCPPGFPACLMNRPLQRSLPPEACPALLYGITSFFWVWSLHPDTSLNTVLCCSWVLSLAQDKFLY